MRRSRASETELQELGSSVDKLIALARARRTQDQYNSWVEEFKVFSRWAHTDGDGLPATDRVVEKFVGWLEMSGSAGAVPEAIADHIL